MAENNTESLFTLKFCLLCASSFFFSSSFNMLIPELPAFLSSLGGASYKGYIIALFTLTAGLSRPFSGRLTDTIGRVPVFISVANYRGRLFIAAAVSWLFNRF
jgi:MFS family permease